MSFLTGKVKSISGTPQDLTWLRAGIGQQLGNVAGGSIGQGYQGAFGPQTPPQHATLDDSSFFYQNMLKPYQAMFSAERDRSLAQAKESAGNLTGSGYNNIFGSSLASSLATEQKTLADILFGTRQQNIDVFGQNVAQRGQDITFRGQTLNAQDAFLRNLLSYATGGVGPPQAAYQPGLLDSVAGIIGQGLGGYLAGKGNKVPTTGRAPNTTTGGGFVG